MHIPTFTLLIVEDLVTDRELYRRALSQDSSCTYCLLEAESVAAGMELYYTSAIDAILLDYGLPDADGLTFLAELHAQSNGSSPPVVMVTGMDDPRIAVRAMKLGAQDYLVKGDLTPELLQSTIRSAIENTRLRLQLQQSQEQAKLALQAKNQQITTIWESMTDAYVTLDRDWRMVYGNSAAIEIFSQIVDFAPEELLGKTHWEIFPWSVGSIVEQEYRRAVTEQVAVHFEIFYDPAQAWFEIHAYPSVASLGVYFRDITERKRMEQERDRFFDLSLDLLAIANFDGYFLRLNPAWERTLGFTNAELMAQPYLDLVHPDDRASTLFTAQELSAGQMAVMFENRYRCKDGSYRWLAWSARPDDAQNLVYAVAHDITDRKRDDEALRRSEELNRRILESHQDCVKVVDPEGRLIYMNDGGQRLMEIDNFTAVEGSQWVEFWQGNDAESVKVALAAAKSGEIGKFEGYCATFKGTPKWWEVIITPILGSSGNVEQVLSVSRDITDRKQTEIALQIGEELFRNTFEYISVGLAHVALDGTWIRVNQKLCEILGYSSAELLATTFQAITVPADLAKDLALVQQLVNGEINEYTLEKRYVHKQGHYVWANLTVALIRTSATDGQLGTPQYFISAIQDISLRKQIELALQKSEGEFNAIFDQSFELMGIVDLDGTLLNVNQAALTSIDARKEDLVGQKFWDTPWWYTPQLQSQLKAAIDRVVNGEFIRYEVQFPNPDGILVTTDFSMKPVFDADGRVITIIAEAHDITERIQAQAALEQRNQELDSFVYVVSHDLKAPLRAIANLSEWIEEDLEGSLSVANQQQMELLRSRVYRMEATIDGLLDYARIGRVDETIESVSIAELLAEVIDSIAPPPTFRIELPPDLPTLSTRRLPLFQVFANLIGNGIKHHDRMDGSIVILIAKRATKAVADRGDCYEFAIADDGPGIAPEHHERMFKIFQAVNPQNRADSTGIGLAIVKKIIEAEGGTIWLESELGKGTTFYFTWPKC
jgi:PAS domain S-box-containing protein